LAIVSVAPWTVDEVAAALDGVLEAEPAATEAWAEALHRATGGWPAAVVTAASAVATAALQEPSPARIEAAIAEHAEAALGLDAATAAAILELAWGVGDVERVPIHLHDGTTPHAASVVAARQRLGPDAVRSAAQARLASTRAPSLALSVDAGDPEAIEAALPRCEPSEPALARAIAWVEQGGAQRLPVAAIASVARVLLGQGEAARAWALVQGRSADPACAYEGARALQRLGRTDPALALLDPRPAEEDALAWRKRGLRWRVLVDRGDVARAIQEAATSGIDDDHEHVDAVGIGAALLWAGYACLVAGDRDTARRRLEQAARVVAAERGREGAGVRARVAQLLGNLAHDEGGLAAATVRYAQAAAAFTEAGEPVGGLMLRGSLAALAIPTFEVAIGLEHGRAAVRGMLARGQWNALVEAVLNLVQLLGRVAAIEEAERLLHLLRGVVDRDDAAIDRARVRRIEAEIGVMRIVHAVSGGAAAQSAMPTRRAVERLFVDAATRFEAADNAREAREAWLRAAALARADARVAVARLHLGRARSVGTSAPSGDLDEADTLALAVESVRVAVAAADDRALDAALPDLRHAASAARERGQLELAWAVDRALHCALRRRLPAGDRRRAVLAQRLLSTLESIMQKSKPIDRPAVRTAVLSDAGDPGALRELLEELEPQEVGAPASSRASANTRPADRGPQQHDAARLERLLRIYRRFAREERLEPLLEQVIDAVMDLTEAERGAVVVRRSDGQSLEVTRELLAGSDGFKFSRSVIDRVLESGEPVLSVDAAADERFDGSRSISHLNLRSVLAVPLRFRGTVLGAAYVDHRLRRGNFDEMDLSHMEEFAELAATAVAHAQALDEVRTQAAKLEHQQTELASLLEAREAEVVALREDVRFAAPDGKAGYRGIVGASVAIRRVFRLIDRLADSDVPVVVYGESGTGKELVARAIHDAGARAKGPFVAENCGAIPETLLESVLFGHAKGAFTGAQKAKAGLFEAAAGGTIFLDEVSEMSPGMQTKLLRVLQEGEIRRVGENHARQVDVRVIAASNRDLDGLVERGEFRRDLFYRIHVVRLDLPALRERVEDIPTLVEHFIGRHRPGAELTVSPAAMRALCSYAWPGNVRELENEVQRWLALCEGNVDTDDLSPGIGGSAEDPGVDPDDLRIRPRVDRLERDLIGRALERTGNNQTQAAQLLGLSRYGLQKKLKRLDG
jgi:transcriptional regulator with GAF, ATPase, and Fis domain/tetratricopeptide (TPR) repeat protein